METGKHPHDARFEPPPVLFARPGQTIAVLGNPLKNTAKREYVVMDNNSLCECRASPDPMAAPQLVQLVPITWEDMTAGANTIKWGKPINDPPAG